MNKFKYFTSAIVIAACLTLIAPQMSSAPKMPSAPNSNSQVAVGVAPDCPYGYYDYAPYACAPYGYYGPEWFTGGVFIGVGPWFHGDEHFSGHVDNRFDPKHGYKGPAPKVGDKREPEKAPEKLTNFKGNEMRDGRGHEVGKH
jgi:hypothetical protein